MGADRQRRRTSTTPPATPTSRAVDDSDPDDRRRHLRDAVRRLAGPLRRRLRHLPVAHPRGQGPQRRDEGRLRLLGRSVDARVEQGRRGRRSSRTTNYWGEKPKLDKVVFKFITDTAAEFQAFKAGEVLGDLPAAAARRGRQHQRRRSTATAAFTANTGNFEALWMNNAQAAVRLGRRPPGLRLRDRPRRHRRAALRRHRRHRGAERPRRRRSWRRTPTPTPSADYKLDLDKVDELMTGDGWAKGADGIWAKDGQKADVRDQDHGRQQAP